MGTEAYVRVKESITTTPSVTTADNGIVSAGVIVAPKGPIGPTLVSNPNDFLNLFVENGILTPVDHPSLFNALRLLQTGSVLVTRSTNTSLVQGCSSNGILTYYNNTTGDNNNIIIPVTYSWPTLSDFTDKYLRIGDYVFHQGLDPEIDGTISVPVENLMDFQVELTGNENITVTQVYKFTNGATDYMAILVNTTDPMAEISDNTGVITSAKHSIVSVYENVTAIANDDPDDFGVRLGDITLEVGDSGLGGTTINVATAPGVPLTVEAAILDMQETIAIGDQFIHVINMVQTTVNNEIVRRYLIAHSGTFNILPGNSYLYADTATSGNSVEQTVAAFTIIPKYGSSSNDINVQVAEQPSGNYAIIYNGDTYEFSMDVNGINEFGQNIYIEYLNNLTILPFTIAIGNTTAPIQEFELNIGAYIGYDADLAASTPYLLQALRSFLDQEVAPIDFVADLGIHNQAFHNWMVTVATNQWAESIGGYPSICTNRSLVSNYVQGCGIDNDRHYWVGPNDVTTALTGFVTELSAATLYIERVCLNKSGSIEFAPTFHKTNGRVSASSLVKLFNKADREYLLDFRVNTIINKDGAFYINDNLTSKKFKDVFSEENNRRTANRINRDMRVLMEQFIGMQNTPSTRLSAQNVATTYLETFIFNQTYRPDAFQVICDKTNNSDDDIRNNKLKLTIKIRYRNAIKFVEVLNSAYDIGSSF